MPSREPSSSLACSTALPVAVLLVAVHIWAGPPAAAQNVVGYASPPVPLVPESPPAHPPAAPCSGCSASCGSPGGGLEGVDLHSGELRLKEVDLIVQGRGMDFVWTRTYRSRLGPNTRQGNGWTHGYDLRVEAEGRDVRVHDGAGRRDLYRRRPDGSFVAVELFREGRFEDDGTFHLTFADQGQWTFWPLDGSPHQGRIAHIRDRNDNQLTFEYDGSGRLAQVVDTLGRPFVVQYRSDGFIDALVDFTGREVKYDYYAGGDLKSARSPIVVGTPNGNDFPLGKTTSYTYTSGFADDRLNHNLLSVTDPEGQTWLVNGYGGTLDPLQLEFDRLVRQQRGDPGDVIDVHYSVDATPREGLQLRAIVNDRVGNVAEYDYDRRGRCRARREFTGRAKPNQRTTPTENRPTARLRPDDPEFFETVWSYNEDARVVRVRHPNGTLTENVYELELDPNAAWRSRGNLRQRHRLPGTHLPVGDQPCLSEYFEYDGGFGGCCGSNFVTRHIDPRAGVTEHDYDARGNRLQTRYPVPGVVEDFDYDAWGQLVVHVLPDNGSGWRQTDTWVYYTPADGPMNGYVAREVVDTFGEALETRWVYNLVGNPLLMTDARGNTSTMEVNALDQVVRRTSPPVTLLGGFTAQYSVDTWYDGNDNVVRVDVENIDALGQLGSNSHFTTSYEYDVLHRRTRRSREVGPGQFVVDEFVYDANRNLVLERHGEAVNGNQPTDVVRTRFDERDLVFRRILAAGDALQSSTQIDYDGNRAVVRRTSGLEHATPRVSTSEVDAYGREVSEVDSMGNLITRHYDPNGNLVELRFDAELCDVPGGANNVRMFEVAYDYDAMNRMLEAKTFHFDPATQAPLGDGVSVHLTTWTGRSERAAVTDDNGNTTTFAYDTAGRLAQRVDARGNSVARSYDANGNVVSLVEAEFSDITGGPLVYVRTSAFDEVDRPVIETDELGQSVSMGYDSRDNLTTLIDALENVSRSEFDGMNRLLWSERTMTDTGTGAGKAVGVLRREWAWDADSRLLSAVDPNGNVTGYAYDPLGRQVAEAFADGTVRTYAYDAHGDLVLTVDANGTRVDSEFDGAGRIAARAITPGAGVSRDTTFETWKHDGMSRLVFAEDDDSVLEWSWDSTSRATLELQNSRKLGRSHDGLGNVLNVAYPGGDTVARTYDALNRVVAVSHAGPVAAYDYVGPRRVERRTTGAGVVTSDTAYDGARRIVGLTHRTPTLTLDQRQFQWDDMHNKTQAAVAGGPTADYAYDSQYRLVRAQVQGASGGMLRDTRYVLDDAGNRLSVVDDGCGGAYDLDPTLPEPADHQMNQYTSTPCIGCLEHDLAGNEVLRVGDHALVRDYRNQVVQHSDGVGVTTYAYDPLGRRIAKTRPDGTEVRFLYDGWKVVEERDANDQPTRTYVHGAGAEIVEWTDLTSGQAYFDFADDLGSTRLVTDAVGAVVERYEYADFGIPTVLDPSGVVLPGSQIGNAWLFTGQYYDEESEFYYFRARHMDPLSGRFVARDPIGIWGDPANLGNGQVYAANNPQSRVDPLGTFSARTKCSGPWPGPRSVYYERIDCGLDSRLPDALCRAMRGAGRAKRDFQRWLGLVANGPPAGMMYKIKASQAKDRFTKWFGGPQGTVKADQMYFIMQVLDGVWQPFGSGQELQMECESDCSSNVNAYTAGYDSSIHLCPRWWSAFDGMPNRRAAIVLHEMTHEYAGTNDLFYYDTLPESPSGPLRLPGLGTIPSNPFKAKSLIHNADTYEALYFDFYVQ